MIYFNPKTHTYYNDLGTYTSVTTKLKSLDSSDWDEIKKNYANKNNLTIEQVTELWNNQAINGTKVHALKESYDTGESYESILNRDTNSNDILKSENLKDTILIGKYPELIVYSNKYKIAGKIDLPIFNEDKSFIIKDYKTDKIINFEPTAYYNKKTNKKEIKYFKSPINYIPNTNWNKYQLQISIYAAILENYGYMFKGGYINHITVARDKNGNYILENDKPIIISEQEYEIKYLKDEAIKILELNK